MAKNLCIIQARMGSTRLPGKILMEAGGKPLLEYETERVKKSKKIDKIVVATGNGAENDKVEDLCRRIGIDCFRGSEEDVLDRYAKCAEEYPEYGNIIRITGDCPLIDPKIIDDVITMHEEENNDFTSNVEIETFPDGMDLEIMKRKVLREAAEKAALPSEREHVTQYIRKNPGYKKGNFSARNDYSRFRFTVDNTEDLEVIKFIIENSAPDAGFLDYIRLLEENPEVMKKNTHIARNEGLLKSLKKDKPAE